MTWDAVRLALGAFMSSPGFGGLAALSAAVIAYRGIEERGKVETSLNDSRIAAEKDNASKKVAADVAAAREKVKADRAAALQSDADQRWWATADWLWENRDLMTKDQIEASLKDLHPMVKTKWQGARWAMMARTLLSGGSDD